MNLDLSVDLRIYVALSAVMFLEYAVWGAWAPVLAARLLGPLKMSGKQTGWIYATLPIACIVSPLVAGQLADQWLNAEWIMAASHLVGAVLLLVAARTEKFGPLFVIMLLYSFFFAATLPLVNSVLFAGVKDVGTRGLVFIWAPIAWALVGYFLTGWRWIFKTEEQGRDCLYFAAILSIAMGACCFLLQPTAPAKTGEIAILKAMEMLADTNFLVFIVASMVIAGLMQFYFLGTARFMQDIGIAGKNVPASMAIAQAIQAIATFFALGFFLTHVGFKWTLVAGAGSWLLMYLVYVATKPRWLVVVSQGFHGLAYVLFMIVGQIFAEAVAKPEIRSSMQALIFAATVGVGLFLGTQLAGIVMDCFSAEGKFQWRKIWLLPCAIMLAGAISLVALFHDPPAAEKAPAEPATVQEVAAVQGVPPLFVEIPVRRAVD
jgi:nucleoside transporter